MINLFDNLRFWSKSRNKFLKALRFYQTVNYLSARIANYVLPYYFNKTLYSPKYCLDLTKKNASPRIIVCITSFPARIKKTWLAVESILRQTVKPDKILLCLTKEQISSADRLPKELIAQQVRGLEIVFCEESIRSHTKYWNAFKDYPDDIIITVDDDIFYRNDLVETLLTFHKQFPSSIITNWAKVISFNDDNTLQYVNWLEATQEDIGITRTNYSIFGVAGVLYPPHCMYKDCLNVELIKQLCLTADDIWLSCQAILAGTTFVFTGYKQNHLPVSLTDNVTLLATNQSQNQVQVDNLNKYYYETIGIKPFYIVSQEVFPK